MTTVFSKIKSWFGKVALAAVHIVDKTDTEVDAAIPEIQKVLTEGASVASLVPGVGPEAVSLLNAGVSLLGAAKAALDGTVAVTAEVQTQVAALAPTGYSFLLVESDVKADVETLLKTYEAEFEAAKTAVTNVTGVTSPAPATPAMVKPAASGGEPTGAAPAPTS